MKLNYLSEMFIEKIITRFFLLLFSPIIVLFLISYGYYEIKKEKFLLANMTTESNDIKIDINE